MKSLIICSEPSTQLAMESQFLARGSDFLCLTPAQLMDDLPGRLAPLSDSALILDLASQALIEQGRSERFPDAAFEQLVERCRERDWPLLLLSDGRVFPGTPKHRYRETEVPAPVSPAGASLLHREAQLIERLPRHLVLRSGPLIAAGGDNALTRLVRRLRAGGEVAVSGEPRFCPTPVADLARVLSGLRDQLDCAASCWGVYHYNSSDPASHYEFAEAVLAAAGQYWDMGRERVRLDMVAPQPDNPAFPVLSCTRIRDTFGIQQLPWRRAMPELMRQIHTGESL